MMPKISSKFKKRANIVLGFSMTFFAVYVFVFGITIEIGSFNFVIEKIDWANVGIIISEINPFFLVASIIVTQFVFIFRALRLNIILSQGIKFFKTVLRITILTFGVNNVLPARAGEILKAYLVSKKFNMTFVSAINTNVCERLSDMFFMSVSAIVTIGIFTTSFYDPTVLSVTSKIKLLSYAGLAFLLAVIALSIVLKNPSFKVFPRNVNNFLNKEIFAFKKFLIKPTILGNAKMLIYGAAVWLCLCAGVYLLLRAFSIEVGFLTAVFIQVIVSFSVVLPQAPGYLGVFQIGCEFALRSFGVDSDTAKSFALILWVIQIIPVTITMAVMAIKGQKITVDKQDDVQ